MDKISQLQKQHGIISQLMFTAIGSLQRDAPAALSSTAQQEMNQEQINAILEYKANIHKQAAQMGKELVTATVEFDKLLNELPSSTTYRVESEQREMMQDLNQKCERQGDILTQRVTETEYLLSQVSDILKEISEDFLQKKQAQWCTHPDSACTIKTIT